MKEQKQKRNEGGITLIALVVTIIIMLVLAGVTLNLALEDGGLINTAKKGIEEHDKASQKEKEELTGAAGMIQNLIDGVNGGTTQPTEDDTPLVSTVTDTNHEDNKEVKDSLGNPLVIPSGFKYVTGENVEDGIVIEDANQNQFVWIPVSNINGDNNAQTEPEATDLIKLKSGSKVEITLGRYTFKDQYNGTQSSTDGTPEIVQKGSERANDITLTFHVPSSESYNFKESTNLVRENGGEGAKSLENFITSVENNHGYYLARYEAGRGTDGKPVSKVGAVWNNITQSNASAAAQRMYEGEEKYTSDLVNSYAWDTAIVYIQAMENENYANKSDGNGSLKNTGATGDEKCHIFDMAGNVYEWTTEYSMNSVFGLDCPCTFRGDMYDNKSKGYTAVRSYYYTGGSDDFFGFRPLLYLK